MNVGTLKTLSYLSSLGLLAGIGYVGYDYYQHGKDQDFFDDASVKALLDSVQPPPAPKRLGLNYDKDIKPAVTEFDWTGAPPPPPPPPDEVKEPVKPKDKPVADILDVKSILWSSQPGDSLCLLKIHDLFRTKGDLWFGIGDTLPKPFEYIAVFDIDGERVTFSFADEERAHESLEPAALKDAEGRPVIVSVDDPSKVREPGGLRQVAVTTPTDGPRQTVKEQGIYRMGGDDIAEFGTDYQRILSEDVKLETYMKDGKRAGLKVREVKPGSIAARHGVQAEDVVISVNGTPITSEQQGIQYVRQNSDTTSVWRVEVLRNGRIETQIYRSPED